MSRMVLCRKYQQQLPGLEQPPYPGSKGVDIYTNVSKKAWDEWVVLQTMLINEQHLNMMDSAHRKFLQEQMERFFAGEEYVKAEGYVPVDK